jgi:hypothetical protein
VELIEPPNAYEGLAQQYERPSVPEECDRTRDRTLLIFQVVLRHNGMLTLAFVF